MTRPADLPEPDRHHLAELMARCPYLSVLARLVGEFAGLLTRRRGTGLEDWMTAVDAADLPALQGFVRGLRKDLPAVTAGLTPPYSNDPIEGVNTKAKFLTPQMYGRAGLPTLATTDPARLNPARHHPLCARARATVLTPIKETDTCD